MNVRKELEYIPVPRIREDAKKRQMGYDAALKKIKKQKEGEVKNGDQ